MGAVWTRNAAHVFDYHASRPDHHPKPTAVISFGSLGGLPGRDALREFLRHVLCSAQLLRSFGIVGGLTLRALRPQSKCHPAGCKHAGAWGAPSSVPRFVTPAEVSAPWGRGGGRRHDFRAHISGFATIRHRRAGEDKQDSFPQVAPSRWPRIWSAPCAVPLAYD